MWSKLVSIHLRRTIIAANDSGCFLLRPLYDYQACVIVVIVLLFVTITTITQA
jgi:hypothetical protein